MNSKTLLNLQQRLIASAIGIAGLLLTLFFASYPLLEPVFVAVVAGVVGFALREYYTMAARLKTLPLNIAAIFTSSPPWL